MMPPPWHWLYEIHQVPKNKDLLPLHWHDGEFWKLLETKTDAYTHKWTGIINAWILTSLIQSLFCFCHTQTLITLWVQALSFNSNREVRHICYLNQQLTLTLLSLIETYGWSLGLCFYILQNLFWTCGKQKEGRCVFFFPVTFFLH